MKKSLFLIIHIVFALFFLIAACNGPNNNGSASSSDTLKKSNSTSKDLAKYAFTINDSLGTKYREEAILRIRNLYYAIPKQNLEKKEYKETIAEGSKTITYYFSPTAIKKIAVEVHNKNETIIKEFCYVQNQLYFIYQTRKSQSQETQHSKLLEMRFYLENNLLLKSIIKQSLLLKEAKAKEDTLKSEEYYAELNNLMSESNLLIGNTRDIELVYPEYEIGQFPSFGFVTDGMIVVEQGVDYKLKGEPYAIADQMHGLAFCEVDLVDLPGKYADMIEQTFDIYNNSEKIEEVKITGFLLMVNYTPHFGEIQSWQDEKISQTDYARSLFENNKDIITLVAEVEGGTSNDAVWARLNSLSKPLLFSPADVNDDFAKNTEKLFLSTKEVKTEMQGYKDYCKENSFNDLPSNWLGYAAHFNYSISAPKMNLSILVLASGEPCGQESYQAVVSKIYFTDFELHANINKAVEMPYSFDFTTDIPKTGFDLNNDGYPELLFNNIYGRSVLYIYLNGEFIPSCNFNIPYRDCPC